VKSFSHAYLLVDALDECTERDKVLKWIRQVARQKTGMLHVLATSRPEQDIEKGLKVLDPILASLEAESVDPDIANYIDSVLQEYQEFNSWIHDTGTCNKVRRTLQRAQGM
jgi:hypothetical protein